MTVTALHPEAAPPVAPVTDAVTLPADKRWKAGLDVDADRWQQAVSRCYDETYARPSRVRPRYPLRLIQNRLATMVEPNSRVLDIGCGDGRLLAALQPSVGVGVDLSRRIIAHARRQYPLLRFVHMRGEDVQSLGDTFDYVIISRVLAEVYDHRKLFNSLRAVCHSRTRLIIVDKTPLGRIAHGLGKLFRTARPKLNRNSVPIRDIRNMLELSGFETIRSFEMMISPIPMPPVSGLLNRYIANLPILRHLCLYQVLIARPSGQGVVAGNRPKSVSVIVPARNEAGHIRELVARVPVFAPRQEIIFVEGGSSDDTWQVVQDVVRTYDGPLNVTCMRQDGVGKGDAVRKGFAAATGDVLMILDADLTVSPEELPTFYETLARGYGEFVNGSRTVYPMECGAMRRLNVLGNRLFACIFTYLLGHRFRDTLCGTKVVTREDYERFARNRKCFGDFDPFGDFDLIFGAARLNLKTVDVPVHYMARRYGQTNISRFRHGWLLLRMCLLAARKIKFI